MVDTRDEFTPATVRRLALRAGYMCAKPDCKQLTVGPSEDRKSRVTMVGVAAHITAASAEGPRYDADLSPIDRASEANGVWMCQTHGKLIDDTESRYTVAELRRWKKQHEEWVFARVASAGSALKHGLTSVSIENVGPFRQRTTISLGRHNVVFGSNGSGKSSLCESIAAFSGGSNFETFRKRWGLFGARSPNMMIEAAISVNGVHTKVRLNEEATALKRIPKHHQTRLHVEVNGNVAPHWPRSLFNIVYLDSQNSKPNRLKDAFRRDLRALAPQLGLSEDQLWDALREELFCSSTFGSRIRRIGEYRAEIRSAGSDHFYETGGVSGSEHTFALFDIILRMIRVDPRSAPWVIIVDSSLFLGLDSESKRRLVNALNALDEPAVQTVVCVNSEEDAVELTADDSERWIGSSATGALTVHSFL
ncbi:AAA family ATPase (plasmid) [Rhizobium hidalgonense]|nr:AAA family ATPase [Rhizobium hidalgonense]